VAVAVAVEVGDAVGAGVWVAAWVAGPSEVDSSAGEMGLTPLQADTIAEEANTSEQKKNRDFT